MRRKSLEFEDFCLAGSFLWRLDDFDELNPWTKDGKIKLKVIYIILIWSLGMVRWIEV